MARQVFNPKTGLWTEGRAEPELLPEDQRSLPEEILTKDIDDPDRVYRTDVPHIRNAIAEDHFFEGVKQELHKPDDIESAMKQLADAPIGEVVPLSQERIDVVRMKHCYSLLTKIVDAMEKGLLVDKHVYQHVWFPENNVNHRAIRDGLPPPDSERPKHLRGFDLVVDPLSWPKSVVGKFAAAGFQIPDIRHSIGAFH